jgi:hypothetical protein
MSRVLGRAHEILKESIDGRCATIEDESLQGNYVKLAPAENLQLILHKEISFTSPHLHPNKQKIQRLPYRMRYAA